MHRGILTALLTGVILLAFALLPPMLPASTTGSLSGSAQAQKTPTTDATNLNSSRSNVSRGKHIGVVKRKAGSGKGGPSGLAVSDEGASGSKTPTKKSK